MSTPVFDAIKNFVKDLNEAFNSKNKQILLYNRLLEKTDTNDAQLVKKHINAFNVFFKNNSSYIQTKKLTADSCIKYSERIFLDIDKILKKLDVESRDNIYRHLVTIFSLLNIGTNDGTEALNALKQSEKQSLEALKLPDTTEGNFLKNTLAEMTGQFENMQTQDNTNPMAMISNMMSSGFLAKFMGDIQTKFASGEMNIGSLMNTVMGMMTELGGDQPEFAQMKEMMNTTMGFDGSGQPPDISKIMSNMTNMMGQMQTGCRTDQRENSDSIPQNPQMPDMSNMMNMLGNIGNMLGSPPENPSPVGGDLSQELAELQRQPDITQLLGSLMQTMSQGMTPPPRIEEIDEK